MPTWCDNRLIVAKTPGGVFDVARVLRELHPDPQLPAVTAAGRIVDALAPPVAYEEVLSFERLLPTPEELFDAGGWFEWRLAYWGTYTDATESRVDEQHAHMVAFTFRTAWEPPDGWFAELARQHPEWRLELSSVEEGSGHSGVLRSGDQPARQMESFDTPM